MELNLGLTAGNSDVINLLAKGSDIMGLRLLLLNSKLSVVGSVLPVKMFD